MPKVSWTVPPYGYTEHPRFSPTNGAYWLAQKIQALISSPYWSSTMFVLTYDENDGSFDYVRPPTSPEGTSEEWVNGQPIGPGFRVPCVVVSPWTVGGRVSTARYDHTSVLRLMETVTGVAVENISAYRRHRRRRRLSDRKLSEAFVFVADVGLSPEHRLSRESSRGTSPRR